MPSPVNKKPSATADAKAADSAQSASPALSAPINQQLTDLKHQILHQKVRP